MRCAISARSSHHTSPICCSHGSTCPLPRNAILSTCFAQREQRSICVSVRWCICSFTVIRVNNTIGRPSLEYEQQG